MTKKEIENIVIAEFEVPTMATTKQYLEIHSAVSENGVIKVDRIDLESSDDVAIVYVPVEDEHFHFAVYVDVVKREVSGIGTESWNRVYFRATSDIFSFAELKAFTTLEPTEYWNKGDLRNNRKSRHSFSCFKIESNPEPDEFEDKLNKLIDVLEKDASGIKSITEKTDAEIMVAMNFHNGNGMLGGMNIDKESIKRISDLNLSMTFDLYADGNKFKEE